MRKKNEALQIKILRLSKEIVNTAGPDSLNIRLVADKAGIATGTIYNYFTGKDDILLTLTEEYWRESLSEMQTAVCEGTFYQQLEKIYRFLHIRISQSGEFLMYSLKESQDAGRERMLIMQDILSEVLTKRIEQDTLIREDIWDETFTPERYSDFLVMYMFNLLKDRTLDISFLLEIVKRTLY